MSVARLFAKCGKKYMSRIGKKPIQIPVSVSVSVSGRNVSVNGPKGLLLLHLPTGVEVKVQDQNINVESQASNLHGLIRSLIANMVVGVASGWSKTLELSGTGYRANVVGRDLNMALGFSHPVIVKAPQGITFTVNENKITVLGADKVVVGEIAAKIRKWRPADPYKAKGLKYEGEVIRRKAGKAAKAVGVATK